MKSLLLKMIVVITLLSMTSFGANRLLNPGFDTQGTIVVDAADWEQAGNAKRAKWGKLTGTACMMFQNFNNDGIATGNFYQAVSADVANGDTVMLKFYAKINNDTRFDLDGGAETYGRIELKNGVTIVETRDIQILSQLTNSPNEWLGFDYRMVNTNDNIDSVVAKFVVSGLTNSVIIFDDTVLDFGSGLQEPGFEESGIWWDLTGNCGLEGWAARTGSAGVAFYGWTADGSADVSQEIITNCASASGKHAIINFSIYAKAESNYYSTSGDTKLSLSFTGSSATSETNIHTALTNSPGAWNQYSVTYDNVGGESISEVKVSFSGSDFAGAGGSQALNFDDAALTISWIPEPIGLFSIGLIGIAFIRSRRK